MAVLTDAEVTEILATVVEEYRIYRENIEYLAVRMGLSVTATQMTVNDCERRLAAFTRAHAERVELLRIMEAK